MGTLYYVLSTGADSLLHILLLRPRRIPLVVSERFRSKLIGYGNQSKPVAEPDQCASEVTTSGVIQLVVREKIDWVRQPISLLFSLVFMAINQPVNILILI